MPKGSQGQILQSPLGLRLALAALLLSALACNLLQVKAIYMDALIGSAFILALWNLYAKRT